MVQNRKQTAGLRQGLLLVLLLAMLMPGVPGYAQEPDSRGAAAVDAACLAAETIALPEGTERRAEERRLQDQRDWVQVALASGVKYRVQAVTAETPLNLELRDGCGAGPSLVGEGELVFRPGLDTGFYLKVSGKQADAAYQLQVAAVADADTTVPLGTLTAQRPDLVRIVLDFMEELRGSPELAAHWNNAVLAGEVRVLYRPDIVDAEGNEIPAYYEFPLQVDNQTRGFIQVAAGEHDYTITHWDFDGLSPTQELDGQANTRAVAAVTQYYKVDNLAYVAEYEQATALGPTVPSQDVLNIGQLPAKIDYTEPLPLNMEEVELGGSTWNPGEGDDGEAMAVLDEPEEFGNLSKPISQTTWSTWTQLKQEYKNTYEPMLASLSNSADDEWEMVRQLKELGEALRLGDERTLRALPTKTGPTFTVTGEGAANLTQETLNEAGLPAGLRITVIAEPPTVETALPVTVTINYEDASSEVIPFLVVRNYALFLPTVAGSSSTRQGAEAAGAESTAAISGAWGPWHYFWAGNSGDQRYYNQMSSSDPKNPSSCASGCGATAWSMLLGWVDNQAAETAYWSGRWGVYRQNGGPGPNTPNAIAPQFWDDGVKNMMWEIRQDIATFCIGGSGATFPWDMDQVAYYLNGRSYLKVVDHYNVFGIHEGRLREYARDSIINGRPAIIGTGWLQHYPLAWGYAWRSRQAGWWIFSYTEYSRWFYVNQGWGGSGDGWVHADTWYAGEVYR